MRSLLALPKHFKYIFSDFDGTLTDQGMISSSFCEFLQYVKKNKLLLILVTGRSVSWGHFFLTHFPIQFAVVESGGVVLWKEGRGKNDHSIHQQVLLHPAELKNLSYHHNNLAHKFPHLHWALDNTGRLSDRAIEISYLKKHKKIHREILQYLDKNKIVHSTSNVHLNWTTGKGINKWSGVKWLVKNILAKNETVLLNNAIYCGDSTNDEVMFKHFKYSLGVANIKPYLKFMQSHPQIIAQQPEINGVLEFLASTTSLKEVKKKN